MEQKTYDNSNFLEKLLFVYTNGFLSKMSNKSEFTIDEIYPNPKEMDAETLTKNALNYMNMHPKALSWWLIYSQFFHDHLYQGMLWFMTLSFQCMNPFLVNYILDGLSTMDQQTLVLYYVILIVNIIMYLLSFFHVMHEAQKLELKSKYMFQGIIYSKSMQNRNSTNENFGNGKIFNLLSSETEKFSHFYLFAHMIYLGPLFLVVYFIVLQNKFGWIPALLGLTPTLISYPFMELNAMIFRYFKKYQISYSDHRTNEVDQLIKGILTVKSLVIENKIMQRIQDLRLQEYYYFSIANIFKATSSSIFFTFPMISVVIVLVSWTSLNDIDQFNSNDIWFVMMVMVNIRMIFNLWLFVFIRTLSDVRQTINRVDDFFRFGSDSEKQEMIPLTKDFENFIEFENYNGHFNKTDSINFLQNITFNVRKNSIHVITGAIGSGKTSILNSILQEIEYISGDIRLENRNIAYCSQTPWIMQDTIENNILMGGEYDADRLDECLTICQLNSDLESWPNGLNTIIGDNGTNLSGGQKSRLQLCRALYFNADLFLLDDPFSSLDPIVGGQVFEKMTEFISNNNKTLVLVTHQEAILEKADSITVMENGKVYATGQKKTIYKSVGGYLRKMSSNIEEEIITRKNTEIKIENTKKEQEKYNPIIKEEGTSGTKTGLHTIWDYYSNYSKINCFMLIIYMIATQLFYNYIEYSYNEYSLNTNKYLNQLLIFVSISTILVVIRHIWVFKLALVSSHNLFNQMLKAVCNAPYQFFISNPSGRIINRFTKDAYTLDELMLDVTEFMHKCTLTNFGMIVTIIVNAPYVLILLIFQIYGILYFYNYYINTSLLLKSYESTSRSPVYTKFYSDMNGSVHLKAFNKVDQAKQKWFAILQKNIKCFNAFYDISRWFGLRIDSICSMTLILFMGLAIILRDTIDTRILALCITYSYAIMNLIQLNFKQYTDLKNYLVNYERMKEYSTIENEYGLVTKDNDKNRILDDGIKFENNDVSFQNVSVKYRDDLPTILINISVYIPSNVKVAVVGRTGAGKSSMLISLLRMNMLDGNIKIGGVDIKQMKYHTLRSSIAYIPQEPFLFRGTLRANLDPFEYFTDEHIINTISASNLLNSFASNTKDILDLEIQYNGMNLSTGQRQLVSLTRALLKQAKLILIDEATANVDFETDNLIQDFLRKHTSNSTVITIAHRINTIKDYDMAIVLDKGQVEEFGYTQELLNQKGLLYELWNSNYDE